MTYVSTHTGHMIWPIWPLKNTNRVIKSTTTGSMGKGDPELQALVTDFVAKLCLKVSWVNDEVEDFLNKQKKTSGIFVILWSVFFFKCLLFFPFFRPSTMETRTEISYGIHEEARDELLLQLLKPHPFWSFQASSAALQAPLLAEELPLGLALAQPKRTAQALRWRLELAL